MCGAGGSHLTQPTALDAQAASVQCLSWHPETVPPPPSPFPVPPALQRTKHPQSL